MVDDDRPFSEVVQHPFLNRDLNRHQVQSIIRWGLQVAGSYKALLTLFHLPERDYQKFMDFLRHHDLKPNR
ncbi:MAG TPA: hypothetical protein VKA68_10250 [bacterium]|nr:hypothetical protein [bacterium]